ncbi:MAG: 4-hydroxybenzoate octaprenyltransferase [Rhodospirillaceae bacterium]|nr:4-hydroxybenzoate octaprenyltransferase [Rhodospirillaceae bacterium]
MSEATTRSDIPVQSWIDRALPAAALPYARLMRLDRPIGTWLLLWPCWWSLALAGAGVFAWHHYVLFGLGSIIMRGAGCTYNDIVDRHIDAAVARTAARPLPAGQVTPFQAWVFLAAQLAAALVILLQFNWFAVGVGAASLALVATYPFMKRITYWPQAWLGLTFNWGALLGWAAATGTIAWPALALYAAGIAWTLGYDTIYAMQDKEDDALIGVKSSALALGPRARPFIAVCYGLAVALLVAAVPFAQWNGLFFAVMALAGAHLIWQAASLVPDDPANCLARFKANRDFGALVMLAIVLARA